MVGYIREKKNSFAVNKGLVYMILCFGIIFSKWKVNRFKFGGYQASNARNVIIVFKTKAYYILILFQRRTLKSITEEAVGNLFSSKFLKGDVKAEFLEITAYGVKMKGL